MMKKEGIHNSFSRIFFLCIAMLLSFSVTSFAQDASVEGATSPTGDAKKGKELFNANCAACHKLDAQSVGPALAGVVDRRSTEWLHKWIKNSTELINSGDADAVKVFEEFNKVPMPPFPQLSAQDIDDILAYTSAPPEPEEVVEESVIMAEGDSDEEALKVMVLVFVLAVFFVLLTVLVIVKRAERGLVEKGNLTKAEIKSLSFTHAYASNKPLMGVTVLLTFLGGLYFAFGYLMQVGVDQGYEPVQPIHFSHKIHSGDNGIDCKYCHSAARTSKTSGIPSVNVCMNCHKSIDQYKGTDKTQDKSYKMTRAEYTAEIQKIYDAVGWDKDAQKYTGKTQPVKWIRIHNLPDFAYFNHSQHAIVAEKTILEMYNKKNGLTGDNAETVACKVCHGPVHEMEVMRQHSQLTMGWCVNCHRETAVDTDNAYYQNYKEVHSKLAKKLGVERLTIANLGGLECAKCHY